MSFEGKTDSSGGLCGPFKGFERVNRGVKPFVKWFEGLLKGFRRYKVFTGVLMFFDFFFVFPSGG